MALRTEDTAQHGTGDMLSMEIDSGFYRYHNK